MQYAVIKTGGKQYKVTPGMVLEVESLKVADGSDVKLDVLLYVDEGKTMIGTPYVSGMNISAKVLEAAKGDKIHIAKFLAKSRYRRSMGHRQTLSRIQIGEFGTGTKKEAVKKTETVESTVTGDAPKTSAPKRASVKKTPKKA